MADNSHDSYAALRNRDCRLFVGGSLLAVVGNQIMTVALQWEMHERSQGGMKEAALALGYIGLVQAIPMFICTLPAGHLADKFDRKKIVLASQLLAMLTGSVQMNMGMACTRPIY